MEEGGGKRCFGKIPILEMLTKACVSSGYLGAPKVLYIHGLNEVMTIMSMRNDSRSYDR